MSITIHERTRRIAFDQHISQKEARRIADAEVALEARVAQIAAEKRERENKRTVLAEGYCRWVTDPATDKVVAVEHVCGAAGSCLEHPVITNLTMQVLERK